MDATAELALPLPVGVIGDLFGVPEPDRRVAAPWVHALLAAPDQHRRLVGNTAAMVPAVEELLRFDDPAQSNGRTALANTWGSDLHIPAGQVVLMLLGSGSRDSNVPTDLGRLELSRREAAPRSFGGGMYCCLGAPLARLEASEVFPRLLTRFPDLAPAWCPVRRRGLSFRGLARLPLRPGAQN